MAKEPCVYILASQPYGTIYMIEHDNPQWIDLAVGLGFDPKPPRGRKDGP